MRFADAVETHIDRFFPATETVGKSTAQFTSHHFIKLMLEHMADMNLTLKSYTPDTFILCHRGRPFRLLTQFRAFSGRKVCPEMYCKKRSKFRCCLTADGTVEITAFEHMAGSRKNRAVFQQLLERRLETILLLTNESFLRKQDDVSMAA